MFVRSAGQWKVDSSRAVVTRAGGWGRPPVSIRVVPVGSRRIGIEISVADTGQGETTATKYLLVPWAGKVTEALVKVVADNDKGDCAKDAIPCYANRRKLNLVKGKNPDYYDVVLTLSGTDITGSELLVAKRVHGMERLEFTDGRYRTVSRQGDVMSIECTHEEGRKAFGPS